MKKESIDVNLNIPFGNLSKKEQRDVWDRINYLEVYDKKTRYFPMIVIVGIENTRRFILHQIYDDILMLTGVHPDTIKTQEEMDAVMKKIDLRRNEAVPFLMDCEIYSDFIEREDFTVSFAKEWFDERLQEQKGSEEE